MTDNYVTLHDYASDKIQNLLYNIRYIKQWIQDHGDDIQTHSFNLELKIPVRKICEEEKICRTSVRGWNVIIADWHIKAIAWKLVIFLSEPTDTSIEKGEKFVQSIHHSIFAFYHTALLGNDFQIDVFLSDWPRRDKNFPVNSYRQIFYSIDQSSSNDEEKVAPTRVRF